MRNCKTVRKGDIRIRRDDGHKHNTGVASLQITNKLVNKFRPSFVAWCDPAFERLHTTDYCRCQFNLGLFLESRFWADVAPNIKGSEKAGHE